MLSCYQGKVDLQSKSTRMACRRYTLTHDVPEVVRPCLSLANTSSRPMLEQPNTGPCWLVHGRPNDEILIHDGSRPEQPYPYAVQAYSRAWSEKPVSYTHLTLPTK